MELGITVAGFVLIGLMIYRHNSNVEKVFRYFEEVIADEIKRGE